jgi:hypothetical protein
VTQGEFDDLTVEFIAAEIEIYRRAQSSKQKNSNRNLKKYFDAREVVKIERESEAASDIDLGRTLL